MVMEDTADKLEPRPVKRKQGKSQPKDAIVDVTNLAEIDVKQPLEVLDEELGSDPYNCTGRYSRIEE